MTGRHIKAFPPRLRAFFNVVVVAACFVVVVVAVIAVVVVSTSSPDVVGLNDFLFVASTSSPDIVELNDFFLVAPSTPDVVGLIGLVIVIKSGESLSVSSRPGVQSSSLSTLGAAAIFGNNLAISLSSLRCGSSPKSYAPTSSTTKLGRTSLASRLPPCCSLPCGLRSGAHRSPDAELAPK